jgi:competence protein ComEC
VERLADGTAFAETAAAVRAHVRRVLTRHVGAVDTTAAAIAIAILIGDRASLDAELEERLQAAGTYHVLAISGGNIALLTALLLAATRAAGLRGGRQALLAGGALAAHAALVGAGPSVTRATLMALVYLLLSALDQRAWTLNALAAAAGAMLLARPLSLLDPGFVLSAGATGAIVALTPALLARVPRRGVWLPAAAVVAASAASELVLLPASATFFNRVTAAGLALNLFAVPLMGVVQCAAMLLLAVEPISGTAADLAGSVVAMAARGLVDSSRLVEIWPALARRVPAPAAWVAALYLAALAACFAGRLLDPLPGRWRWRTRRAAPLVASFAALWLLLAPGTWAWPWRAAGVLRVTFLDVGQGDATLVELPGGGSWLVDAGGLPGSRTFDIGARVVAPVLWARGIGRLDTLVLTHGDPDHAGGAGSVLGDFGPRTVWEGVPVPAHALLRDLRERARGIGSGWTQVRAGVRHASGAAGIEVRHPPPPDWERQRVRNDDSVVLEIRFGGVSVVLPGDIGSEVEHAIARHLPPARLRVLKAAHHGSRSSSGEAWLDALRPAVAVISCGRDNPYGHPALAVLERLQARGIEIYRTDEDGAVTIETDGTEVEIRTFTGRVRRMSVGGRQ